MPKNQIIHAIAGTAQLVSITEPPDLPGALLESIEQPNMDGVAFRRLGSKAEPAELYCITDVDNAAGDLAARVAFKALEGQFINFYDNQGNLYQNFVVLNVRFLESIPCGTSVGGANFPSPDYLVRFVMTVQYPYGSG